MSKNENLLFAASMALVMAFAFSCSSDDAEGGNSSSSMGGKNPSSSSGGSSQSECNGSPISGGGGKGNDIANYETKKIGDQTWMAENLDYAVECSKCYDNDPANCAIYGRLYDWATVMALPASCISTSCASQVNEKHRGICPEGWHVPSEDEWDTLINFVDDRHTAGKHLKAASGWDDYEGQSGNGEDTHGFAALPGGSAWPSSSWTMGGSTYGAGTSGSWWVSDEGDSENAKSRSMENRSEGTLMGYGNKNFMHSVRCLQD